MKTFLEDSRLRFYTEDRGLLVYAGISRIWRITTMARMPNAYGMSQELTAIWSGTDE